MKVYCIKVALFYNKRIYRNIEIIENQSLADLHASIFEAFDRYDEHLYSFFLTGKAIKSTRKIYDFPEITHPMNLEDLTGFAHKKRYNAEKTKIRDLVQHKNPGPQGQVRVQWLCHLNGPMLHLT